MPETKRARFVCHACSVRKKACDKTLPTCSFCAERKLQCKYDAPARRRKAGRAYNPGRHFVALDSLSSSDDHQRVSLSKDQSIMHRVLSSFHTPVSQSIHELLNQQVIDIISLADCTLDDISERYFQTFHQVYPIISPELFRQRASKYRDSTAPADFSILLLAMYLGTSLPGPDRHFNHHVLNLEQLYITTKSLFAQVHSAIHPCLPLLQVSFIIATWEYAWMRPETAYVSMSTCSGLARILGIGKQILKTPKHRQGDAKIIVIEIEKGNLAWAMAMLERTILVELHQKALVPLVEFPDPDCQLPSDLPLNPQPDCHSPSSATLSSLQATDVSWFGRQAQAVFILDQVLSMICSASNSGQDMLSDFVELDHKIRSFLALVMDESRAKNTPLCSAVAVSIRSLFLLHWDMLNVFSFSGDKGVPQQKHISQVALATACNMIIDAVLYTDDQTHKSTPICCVYNLKEAIKYMSEQQKQSNDEAISSDLDTLFRADKAYLVASTN